MNPNLKFAAVNNVFARMLLAASLTTLLTTGCSVNPVSGRNEVVLMSESQEIAIGRQNHSKIIASYGKYDNPSLQQYIAEIGARLAEQSHRSELIYRFTLLDSTDINAFALPGGYIYITRGLLAYLNSEAELAAVLGHEIGHVTARHGVRQQTAATAAGIGYTIASILVPELGSSQAQNAYGLLSNALLSGYGREHELEADRLGAEYLAKIGNDPQAMLAVIGVLKNQDDFARLQATEEGRDHQGYHGLFASHPDNDTRLQEVIQEAKSISVTNPQGDNRERFLKQIDGLIFGDSPDQGIRRGQNFYHPELDFALGFPENWVIKNLPDRLIAIAPQGKAQIQIQVDDINKRISPQEFMAQRLGLKDLQRGETLSGLELADELQGYTGLTEMRTAKGPRLGRVSVIYLGQRAFIFTGFAVDESIAGEVDPLFLKTAQSIHRLTSKERTLAKPLRIKIIKAEKGSRYSEMARRSPVDSYAEQQLRLINNHYPNGEPEPQRLIKTIQ